MTFPTLQRSALVRYCKAARPEQMMHEADDLFISTVLKPIGAQLNHMPVDVERLVRLCGVTSIERRPIASDAMLLPMGDGYKIILNDVTGSAGRSRQRFSLAHELAHLLLKLSGLGSAADVRTKHRRARGDSNEELLCDKIAAEILMPRHAFVADGSVTGWSLKSLKTLSTEYQTSIPATAIRVVDLMPETCLLGVWRPPADNEAVPKLQWSHARGRRFGVPSAVPRSRLWLISRALHSAGVQSGIAPVVDKVWQTANPNDVPAEALAWGQGEYRQVMLYYYPERELSDDMVAIGKATWRLQ